MPTNYEIRRDALTLAVSLAGSCEDMTHDVFTEWREYFELQLSASADLDRFMAARPPE